MTVAHIRRPTCEARSAARAASPMTYTPPWKYRTTWRGSIPSTVISAVGTPPSSPGVTVTSAGSGCADSSSRSSRRCSLTSLPAGKADCRRIASRASRCSVLTEDFPSVRVSVGAPHGGSPMQSAAEFPAGRPATARLAGRQVRGPHRIKVTRLTEPARTGCRREGGSVLMLLRSRWLHSPGPLYRGLWCRGLWCRGLRCLLLWRGRGTVQFLAADPNGGNRDEQGEQPDPRGNLERTGKAGRQGVIVDGRRRGGARLRRWLARRRMRDLGPDAVRDGRPGDGAEQREPDRAADLLGGVEQAGGDTRVLFGHVVKDDQGQRDEYQAEPERAHQLRAEQLTGIAGVLGQPGKPEHPARDHGRAGHDERSGADPWHQLRGQPGGDHNPDGEWQVGDARPDRAVAEDVLYEQGEEEEQSEKPGGDAQHDQVGARPVAVGQDPHREQRARAAPFDEHERYEKHHGRGQRCQHLRVTPVRHPVGPRGGL